MSPLKSVASLTIHWATKNQDLGDSFGSFDDASGKVIYELNDFDEAMRADYQFDLWRMAVSIVLVARQNNDLAMHQLEKVVDVFSQTYLDTLRSYRDLDDASRLDYDRRYGDNHGLRHAVAYRALTRRTDPHLGWMHLAPITVKCCDEDRDGSGCYSVRERSPFKEAFLGEVLDTRASFSVMAGPR